MKWYEKVGKWLKNKKIEKTVLSPNFPYPKDGEIIEISYSRKSRAFKLLLCVIFIGFCFFVSKSWILVIIISTIFSWNFWREWPYYNSPLLVINNYGLTYKGMFFPWNDIAETYIQVESGEPDVTKLVLTFNYSEKKITIHLDRLDRTVEEIGHYVEIFKGKASVLMQ
jgi:hypothetical protein